MLVLVCRGLLRRCVPSIKKWENLPFYPLLRNYLLKGAAHSSKCRICIIKSVSNYSLSFALLAKKQGKKQ